MFPKLGDWCADDMAVIRSMTTPVNEHVQGNYVVHTGFPFIGHPSAGAWVNYGLGTSNRDVPGFVVLQSGNSVVPHGGVGFLPASKILPGNVYAPFEVARNTRVLSFAQVNSTPCERARPNR